MSHLRIPIALIVVSIIFYAIIGTIQAGAAGGVIAALWVLFAASISAMLGIAACFLVAAIFGTSFGEPKDAFVKLSAVILFAPAMGLLVALISPLLGVLVMVVLFFGLLQAFFELEILELFAFVIALWIVQGTASWAVSALRALLTGA